MISLIAALSKNYVIGKNNRIPWYFPEDLSWFRENTLHKTVVMGRKTWESIGCCPLPERKNIIISKKNSKIRSNNRKVKFISSCDVLSSVCNLRKEEVMIIGGELVYKYFLDKAKILYLTHINLEVEGDRYFPRYHHLSWNIKFLKMFQSSRGSFSFEILERDD